MTRIPLSTDIKTRVGDTTKDARLKNAYVEVRGDQSVVRKRPCAQGGISVGTGTAQGGIGLNIGGIDYVYTFYGDVGELNYLGGFAAYSDWNSATSYAVGDSVILYTPDATDPFENPPTETPYYCYIPHTNKALGTPYYWSTTPTTSARYRATITILLGNGTQGAICGSQQSAGYSCWAAYQYQSCATKYSPTQLWYEFYDVSGSTLRFRGYTDVNPFNCSLTPIDNGIQNVGTVATI